MYISIWRNKLSQAFPHSENIRLSPLGTKDSTVSYMGTKSSNMMMQTSSLFAFTFIKYTVYLSSLFSLCASLHLRPLRIFPS